LKIGLKLKFVIYLISLTLLICSVFLFFHLFRIDDLVRLNLRDLGYELARDLSYSSRPVIVSGEISSFAPLIEGILEEQELALVALYDSAGHVIFAEKRKNIEERIIESTLDKLVESKSPLCIEGGVSKEEKIYDCYAQIWSKESQTGEVIGYCRVALTLDMVYQARADAVAQSILIAVLVLILGFFVSLILAEKMVKPMRSFIKGAEKIGKGDLDYQFRIKTGDEIEQLAESFNVMTEQLRKSRKDLQETNDVLEIRVRARTEELEEFAKGLNEQVDERTKELRERLNELERFHKLIVDREMKMIAMKKELKQLKDKSIEKNKK